MAIKVFISYSHLDGDMVFGEIKPLLQAAPGVQVTVDVEDFLIGTDPQKNMEDAVRANDFTIAVITQDYVDSEWATLEATIAIDLKRLVPIVFEMPRKVPARIRDRHSYAEALNPLEWDGKFRRLLNGLGVSAEDADQALQRRAPRNLQSMHCRVRHAEADAQLREFWKTYNAAKPSYQRLRACKELHDAFHKAQLSYRNVNEKKTDIRGALGTGAEARDLARLWRSLKTRFGDLRTSLANVLKEAQSGREMPEMEPWERDIEEGAEELGEAVEAQDLELTKGSLEKIRTRIWTEPTFLNRAIVAERDRLALPALCKPLACVASFLRAVQFEPDVARVVNGFLEVSSHFEVTGKRLLRLIGNHNHLQALDDDCTKLDENLEPSAREIQRLWKRVEEHAGKLDAQDLSAEVGNLEETRASLKEVLAGEELLKPAAGAAPDEEKKAAWLKALRDHYTDVREAVNQTFHSTDNELKRVSGQLVVALQRVQETLRDLGARTQE